MVNTLDYFVIEMFDETGFYWRIRKGETLADLDMWNIHMLREYIYSAVYQMEETRQKDEYAKEGD